MSKQLRQQIESFKSAWDRESKQTLRGNDLKEAQHISKYLWRKVRQQMTNDRDIAIDQ